MILAFGLMAWTAMFLAMVYVSWKWVTSHMKVYLLILYNAAFLAGVFILFPLLEGFLSGPSTGSFTRKLLEAFHLLGR